ncbi:MAG: hypothetical protein ACR65X_10730 [Methylocystis sp.]
MIALTPDLRETFSAAAQEYRKQHGKPQRRERHAPDDGLPLHMRRGFVHELLDAIPREAVAAQLFIEVGDDAHAHEHLMKLVLNVRELARTWNETRCAESEAS